MAKVLVIISSGDLDKALTGLMWATNALRFNWVEDLEVIFFGPVEKLIAKGEKALLDAIARLKAAKKEPLACRRIAEIEGYLDQLESRVKAEYIGARVAELLSKGYIPLTF